MEATDIVISVAVLGFIGLFLILLPIYMFKDEIVTKYNKYKRDKKRKHLKLIKNESHKEYKK